MRDDSEKEDEDEEEDSSDNAAVIRFLEIVFTTLWSVLCDNNIYSFTRTFTFVSVQIFCNPFQGSPSLIDNWHIMIRWVLPSFFFCFFFFFRKSSSLASVAVSWASRCKDSNARRVRASSVISAVEEIAAWQRFAIVVSFLLPNTNVQCLHSWRTFAHRRWNARPDLDWIGQKIIHYRNSKRNFS